jgi:poly-gamma-glutamate capsule biosynthesis protein CapA/YwtB (metallophosphatase superfamily)
LFALVAAITACTSTPPAAQGPAPVTYQTATQPQASADASTGTVTLAFAGDVNFAGRDLKLLNDTSTTFGSIASVLSAADVTALNLETPVTDHLSAPQPKTFHFHAPPTAFDAVRSAGVDVVTLANNHIEDYGRVGLADTLSAVKAANFPYVGIGTNAAEAWAPWITTVRGTRIAYLGISNVQELQSSWIATPTRSGEAIADDLPRTLAAIKAAKKQADIVIVFMHWGTEGDSCPDGTQKKLAKQMSDAGADIIIGAHVHTLQGNGWLGHTFVAYGMGNFLWYIPSWSTETGVLRLTVNTTPTGALSTTPLTAKFIPAIVSNTGQPVVQTGSAATRILDRYASLRACAGLTAAPTS